MVRCRCLLMITLTCALGPLSGSGGWFLVLARIRTAPVQYANHSSLKAFPVPVVSWRRPGLAGSEAELEQIKSEVLYPIINESLKPVSAIVVEFSPLDTHSIGLVVMWADGASRESLIARNPKGDIDPQAYKVFFATPVP